jgi:SAM-dependent methyltransferase
MRTLDLNLSSTVKVEGMSDQRTPEPTRTGEAECVPNHHAHYPGFSGLFGLVAAASMVVGRDDDARLAIRLGELAAGDTAVDIGCGPGVAVRRAARLGARAIGIDPASVMLNVARLLTWRASAVRYLEGTAENMPVADATATVVWSIATVHHWHDLDAGLREALRVLGPDGRLVAIERRVPPAAHGHASHGWSPARADAFATRARELGFRDVRVEHNRTGRRSTLSVVGVKP